MEKLKKAIEKFLAADTSRKAGAAKGAITRIVNEHHIAHQNAVAVRSELSAVLREFEQLPDWLHQRFTPGSLYKEGDRIMGWWDVEVQVQAEELPLERSGQAYSVSFYARSKETRLWQLRGFYEAEHLPLTFFEDGSQVTFAVERSPSFIKYGYALPCNLQWYWNQEDGLIVTRSIIPIGWWQAWKWWVGAQWWYLANRPELFGDLNWWGEHSPPVRYQSEDDPYAAVLGGQHSEKST